MWRLWGGRVKNCQWVTSLEIVPVFFIDIPRILDAKNFREWEFIISDPEAVAFFHGSNKLEFDWQLRTYSPIWLYSHVRSWYWFSFSQRNSKRKFLISAVKVLIRSGHNLNQTRDIPLVSVTICQMWQITPIFRNQEKPSNDSFRTKWYCFCGIARSPLYPQTPRPLKTWRFA